MKSRQFDVEDDKILSVCALKLLHGWYKNENKNNLKISTENQI